MPACVTSAVAVGSVYDANIGQVVYPVCTDATSQADQIVCHSNGGARVDLLAPGSMISGPAASGTIQIGFGTSYSAPHAAGVAVQVWSKDPTLTPDQVISVLKTTGKSILDPRTSMSFPRVDARAAVALPFEDCDDETDNDLDGRADCLDPECDGEVGPQGGDCELGTEATCDDGADNDADGVTDCADDDCAGETGAGGETCEPGEEISCADGGDNDADDLVDCDDPDCDGETGPLAVACERQGEVSCEDGGDNDGNGLSDCDDPACAEAVVCQPDDEDTDEEPGGCGCASAPTPNPALLLGLALPALFLRRRR